MQERLDYLVSLLPNAKELEEKHWRSFCKYSTYQGNGVYQWRGILATSPREVFLCGILEIENINYDKI